MKYVWPINYENFTIMSFLLSNKILDMKLPTSKLIDHGMQHWDKLPKMSKNETLRCNESLMHVNEII